MDRRAAGRWSRRKFVGAGLIAAGAPLLGLQSRSYGAEPSLETTRLRMGRIQNSCHAPQFMAEELLRAEGFSTLQYVRMRSSGENDTALEKGEIDLSLNFSTGFLLLAGAGAPVILETAPDSLESSGTGCPALRHPHR